MVLQFFLWLLLSIVLTVGNTIFIGLTIYRMKVGRKFPSLWRLGRLICNFSITVTWLGAAYFGVYNPMAYFVGLVVIALGAVGSHLARHVGREMAEEDFCLNAWRTK